MIRILTAGLLLSTLAAGSALAQPAGGDQEHHGEHGRHHGAAMMEKLDTNKDGSIDAAEFEAAAATRFSEIDANGDGSVTKEEATAHAVKAATERATERAGKMFERLDADKDGTVTQAEFTQARGRMFEHMDRNDDGTLSRDDRPKRKHHGDHRHEGGKPERDNR
ncbi:EF-hand domain-containing protein [Indioceanicola profundi]|uniref:EF-hand domain-containing protein n=1 Tax=Indioceanicola profundi TaxID=2220096 RepID=UPI0013C48A0A|nr:EF-hand domain-containing protein [Indioceanicola profundi]